MEGGEKCSGLPNAANIPIPMCESSFAMGCWNARAFFHSKLAHRNRKIRELGQFVKRFQIFGILEAHGTKETAAHELRFLSAQYEILHFGVANFAGEERPDIGGVTVLISRQILNSSPPRHLVDGRVVEVCIGTGPCTTYVFFVHNFRLGNEGMTLVENAIFERIRQGKTVVLCGDFNMDPPGERRITVSDPGGQGFSSQNPDRDRHARPLQARWQRIFDELVEVKSSAPNHFCKNDLSLARLNRVFSSIPRSALNLFKHRAGVIRDPLYWDALGISDHAPVFWEVSPRPSIPQGQQRIKKEWCRHPQFKKSLDALVALGDLESMPIGDRSAEYKELMKIAAKDARDCMFPKHASA